MGTGTSGGNRIANEPTSAAIRVSFSSSGADEPVADDRRREGIGLVPVPPDGAEGDGNPYLRRTSANGRIVAFFSDAASPLPGDANGSCEAFVRDAVRSEARRTSVESCSAAGDDDSGYPSISADEACVAFSSLETSNGPLHSLVTGSPLPRAPE